MMLELLSMLIGGGMRIVPELIGLWNKKTDYAHELQMLDRQAQIAQQKAVDDRSMAQLEATSKENLAWMESVGQALKGQMQVTGNALVDALNFALRPVTTYYFLALYGMYKIALFVVACHSKDVWMATLTVYDDQDRQMLWGILSFWFVGRVFEKARS